METKSFLNKEEKLVKNIKDLYLSKKYSVSEVANTFNTSYYIVYNLMRKNNIPRRKGPEVNYATYKSKPPYKIKKDLTLNDESLKVAGIMLYLAEGAKGRATVDFANSDPYTIKIFLEFLRKICGISEQRLRVYIYAYSYHNIDEIKQYWSNVAKIPQSQFTKPYIRKGNPNLSGRKMTYGLIHIRYNDKRLLQQILKWIEQYVNRYN